MKYRVRLTDKAERDVVDVLAWFREQSAVEAGGRWFAQLMAHIDKLETMPERCGLAAESEGLDREIRELHLGRRRATYRLLFEIRGQVVYILRVWHSARDAVSRTKGHSARVGPRREEAAWRTTTGSERPALIGTVS